MALDALGLELIAPHVRGAAVLCLGYPDITAKIDSVRKLLGVEPQKFTDHGVAHKISWPLPETVDTLRLAGAALVDCVDVTPSRGVERAVDLNVRQEWPQKYSLVINPGTLEHCFDVAAAMFNAWRAVRLGGVVLHVAPLTMLNHGFWNFCPTAIFDFAEANGGRVMKMQARGRDWKEVELEPAKRFQAPSEVVLYALVRKADEVPERLPTQSRYR